jgi:hypothetical protein
MNEQIEQPFNFLKDLENHAGNAIDRAEAYIDDF